jgi:hypothetical protein
LVLKSKVRLILTIVPISRIRDGHLLLNRGDDDILLSKLLCRAVVESRVELLLRGNLLLMENLLLLLGSLLVLLRSLLMMQGRGRDLLLHLGGGVLLELLRRHRPVSPRVDGGRHSGPRHGCGGGELRPDAAYLMLESDTRLCGLRLNQLGCGALLWRFSGIRLWLDNGAGHRRQVAESGVGSAAFRLHGG